MTAPGTSPEFPAADAVRDRRLQQRITELEQAYDAAALRAANVNSAISEATADLKAVLSEVLGKFEFDGTNDTFYTTVTYGQFEHWCKRAGVEEVGP